MLIGASAASFLAVGMVVVLTPTAIVDDSGSGSRILRLEPAPATGPGTPLPGPGRGPESR
jgi:hypothetical protein